MNILNTIFGYYDKLIGQLPASSQAIISLALLLVLVWQILLILKHGHWIFIAGLILLLPGTWPAARHVGVMIFTVFKFLFVRIVA